MLITYYVVRMNGSYMNTFYTYSDACDLRANLERRFPNARITIESDCYYE